MCLKRRTTHINMRSSGKPDSPLSSPGFVVYRDPYKKNYKEKISSGTHFHNVLCLSEAKGMDINMGIRVRLCSDWCLREADILSDYPQTSVSCIVRTQYLYFAQRYAGITGFGPLLVLTLNFYFMPLASQPVRLLPSASGYGSSCCCRTLQ